MKYKEKVIPLIPFGYVENKREGSWKTVCKVVRQCNFQHSVFILTFWYCCKTYNI